MGCRSSQRARGAREPEPRRADRDGSLPALRRPGNDVHSRLRPAHRVAELDLQPAERGRRARRAQGLRHRLESEIQLGAGMSAIDYAEKIPNNVNLVGDRTLQRALEHWQPHFLQWWQEMGPSDFAAAEVYLRTAISVDAQGWAHYGTVRMPDYRWGIFLADAVPERKIGFGDAMGQPVWQQVPGEYRSTLRRLIVTQGDTEPASVEQQRLLGHSCPSLYDLRNLFQINVEEARHMFVGETGLGRVVKRTLEVMKDLGSDDPAKIRAHGAVDLQTLQKYLNFWCSSSLDLFGSEISSNSAANFANALKGRPDESQYQDHVLREQQLELSTPEGKQSVPMLNALNEVMRESYLKDCEIGIKRWNRTIERAGFNIRLSLPAANFRRSIGAWAGKPVAPDGKLIEQAAYEQQLAEWIPSEADRVFVHSLMQRVIEPGKIAGWIAPPERGVNNLPVEYAYVKLH